MFLNNLETPKFDFHDIALVPSVLSKVESRSQVNLPFPLPLVASPMNSVLSIKKKGRFNENFFYNLLGQMIVCSPRDYEYSEDNQHLQWSELTFKSISLQDFRLIETDFKSFNSIVNESNNILVDIANGHMRKLLDLSKLFIEKFPNKKLMIGNIANPYTYHEFAKIGVHYCRISIGSGSVCTSSSNAAIHYPMASLIYECNSLRQANSHKCRIVADGGFKNFDDIIKGLALGCFLPYAEVITSQGKKKISEINKGDFVLTHKNRFKQVINIFEYENNKEIVEINDIPSTSNHHYYVIKRIYREIVNESNIHEYAEWIAAENLNNDYLLIDLTNQNLM